ncbi:MAG: hypothetical protein ACR652_04935 [Methylocystis sp.]|uniref:hypothetical protein n=1 Tax=Methylocystis sp. TaxID=1911079 RepID=UPI003DA50DE7
MSAELAPIELCQKLAGLAAHEVLLGVAPGGRHARILANYRRARRSPAMARARIVADLRAALLRGAAGEAADLLLVLRRFLALEGAPPSLNGNTGSALRAGARPRRARRTIAAGPRGPFVNAPRPLCAVEPARCDAVIIPLAGRLSPESDSRDFF